MKCTYICPAEIEKSIAEQKLSTIFQYEIIESQLYLPTGYWNEKKTFCIAEQKWSKQFNMKIKESLCTYHRLLKWKKIFCIAEYKSSKQFNMKIKEGNCTYHSFTEMKKKTFSNA